MNQSKETFETAEKLLEDKVEAVEQAYDRIIHNLRQEKNRIERDVRKEYRNAKKYVRSNPERSIGLSFAAGLFMGALLTRAIR